MALLRLLKKRIPAWSVLLISAILAFILLISNRQTYPKIDNMDEYYKKLLTQASMIVSYCADREPCRRGTFAFHIHSGEGQKEKPKICFDGNYEYFPQSSMGRGMNLLVIDEIEYTYGSKVFVRDAEIKEPTHTGSFDIYGDGDKNLLAFLEKVKQGNLVFFVIYDDAFYRLSDQTKSYIADRFGSRSIMDLKYRSMWAFVGQKDVKHAGMYEKHNLHVHGEWADPVEIKNCLSIPLSESSGDGLVLQKLPASGPLCDLPHACSSEEIAVRVSSSSYIDKQKHTNKFCIEGESDFFIDGKAQMVTGRGFNFIVYDPHERKVVQAGSFDTYKSSEASRHLANFLLDVNVTHILIGAISDEGSSMLSAYARDSLKYFGAARVADLQYRSVWSFVGQMGINSSEAFEEMNHAERGIWGKTAVIAGCIPVRFKGAKTVSDMKNNQKHHFCKTYEGYEELCTGNHSFGLIPLDDMSLYKNLAYNIPIAVIPGGDLQALHRCLDSLLKVPGLQREHVFVILEGQFAEPTELVDLYGFNVREIVSHQEYTQVLLKSLEVALSADPHSPYAIILEQYLEVSPDFLRYFSQTIQLLQDDESLFTISAWNDNGFSQSSGDNQVFYRTENFPGFGWILQRRLWKAIAQKNFECCRKPTWHTWFPGESRNGMESIVPDLSRIKRTLAPGVYIEKPFLRPFLKDRIFSRNSSVEPRKTYLLKSAEYEEEISRLIDSSIPFDLSLLEACIEQYKELPPSLFNSKSAIFSVYYHQSSPSDESVLRRLGLCFGLFVHEESNMRNLHKGLLRFTKGSSQFLLIGSESPYFSQKLKDIPVIK